MEDKHEKVAKKERGKDRGKKGDEKEGHEEEGQ